MKPIRSHPIRTTVSVFLLLIAILYFSDPLNRFIVGMLLEDMTGVNWQNGLCSRVDLPASASPEDILHKAFGSGFFQILRVKKFWMPNNTCWAVRCKQPSHDGRVATLLLYFQSYPNGLHPGTTIEWWTIKFYY